MKKLPFDQIVNTIQPKTHEVPKIRSDGTKIGPAT